jgi:hypothetical protein
MLNNSKLNTKDYGYHHCLISVEQVEYINNGQVRTFLDIALMVCEFQCLDREFCEKCEVKKIKDALDRERLNIFRGLNNEFK